MKTEFEMTPEMEPGLDKLEAELRKLLAGKVPEDRLAPHVEHLQAHAIRSHDGLAAKDAFWQHDDITDKLEEAEDDLFSLLTKLDPGVQQVITYAVRRTQLTHLSRDEQDRQIAQDLRLEKEQGVTPYIDTVVREQLPQLMLGIKAAREERREGGRPTEALLYDLALAVGAE